MGHPFENRREAEVPATPNEVWAAIASGPGIDSWFMGRSEVRPGADGTVRTVFGEYAPELDVTAWDPARRFAYRSGEAPDGRFIAYEFLIEGRAGGTTVLRTVTSGFLPGDDWADEFEAMTLGGEMYFRTLVEYLASLRRPVRGAGHRVRAAGHDLDPRPARCCAAPSACRMSPKPGDRARLTADGIGSVDGVLYFANAHTIGVRTQEALYRFLRGFGKPTLAAHHLFAEDADPGAGPARLGILAQPDPRLPQETFHEHRPIRRRHDHRVHQGRPGAAADPGRRRPVQPVVRADAQARRAAHAALHRVHLRPPRPRRPAVTRRPTRRTARSTTSRRSPRWPAKTVFVHGTSSGAALALEAAKRIPAIAKLAVYEPPFIVDDTRSPIPDGYLAALTRLVADGRNGDAVKMFMRFVGTPAIFTAVMPVTPVWPKLKAVAPTLPYDIAIMQDHQRGDAVHAPRSGPRSRSRRWWRSGGKSPAWMTNATRALADALPDARHRTLPGQNHMVKPQAIAPVLTEFFRTDD